MNEFCPYCGGHPDPMRLLTSPPKYKCSSCGEYWRCGQGLAWSHEPSPRKPPTLQEIYGNDAPVDQDPFDSGFAPSMGRVVGGLILIAIFAGSFWLYDVMKVEEHRYYDRRIHGDH